MSAVDVSVRTWARETHNLFDFEAKDSTITSQDFSVTDNSAFVRENNGAESSVQLAEYQAYSKHPSTEEGERLILVERRHGVFYLNRPRWGTDDRRIQRCWQLIRNSDSATNSDELGHRLTKDDIIKFGRSQFKVRQLSFKEQGDRLDDGSEVCQVCPTEFESLADKPCRICLQEGSSHDAPLVAPCKCRGSIQYVHLDCLKCWIKDRIATHNGGASFVISGDKASPLSCELCKSTYQTTVQMGDQSIPLVDMTSPFVVLENTSDHRLHVLPITPGSSVKIGRGHDCHMNIPDTSISREQAMIELIDGSLILKDKGSRFGTYVKITKSVVLHPNKKFAVQVGRSILELTAKPVSSPEEHESLQATLLPLTKCSQGDDAQASDTTESPKCSSSAQDTQDEFLSCGDGS